MKMYVGKRGFTLVELLAVIVILAIILAIAIPGIAGIIGSATRGAFGSDAKMVLKQLEYQKLEDPNFDESIVDETMVTSYNLSNENYQDLAVGIVSTKPYIVIVGKGKWAGLKACGTMQNMKVVNASDTTTCQTLPLPFYNASKGVNRPVLAAGMTPVKWDGSNWIETTETDNDWYDYIGGTKKWANARTADGSMWVWIPRFAYQIATGYHTNAVGAINVKFLINKTNTTSDKTAIFTSPVYTGTSQNNYVLHPAFSFNGSATTGMWVAKFEASGATNSLAFKPNEATLRSLNVNDMFAAARNMETNNLYGWGTNGSGLDTHMMKNSEWGAAAYLAQSTYGKNSEVWINNSNTFVTGCAGSAADAGSVSGCDSAYNTANGLESSTTGTIYGIYDMSGGSWEYVMANLNNQSVNSGFYDVSSIEDRYIDRYTDYSATKFGDAVYETSNRGLTSDTWYGWYGDSAFMPSNTTPWFVRGGNNGDGTTAGIYAFEETDGAANTNASFRAVVLVGDGM